MREIGTLYRWGCKPKPQKLAYDPLIDEHCAIGYVLKWRAEEISGAKGFRLDPPFIEILHVPPQWTVYLLMEKAGLPRGIIAEIVNIDGKELRKILQLTTACMLWPPYAARIEKLMTKMPRFPGPGETLDIPPAGGRYWDKFMAEVSG